MALKTNFTAVLAATDSVELQKLVEFRLISNCVEPGFESKFGSQPLATQLMQTLRLIHCLVVSFDHSR